MKNFKRYIIVAIFALAALILMVLNLSVFGSEMTVELQGVNITVIVFGYEMVAEQLGDNKAIIFFSLLNILIGMLLAVLSVVLLLMIVRILKVSRTLRNLSGRPISKTAAILHKLLDFLFRNPVLARQPTGGTTFQFIPMFKNIHKKLIWEFKKIVLKYNIKREYFTILLPLILAAILLGLSTFSETFNIFHEEKAPDSSNQSSDTIKIESAGIAYKNLDQMIVIATLIVITPYSMDVYLAQKRRKRYEEEFAGFLYELSELLRGGLDPVSAIREIASPTVQSERSLRALGPHLKKAAALLDWGRPFETVITKLAESLKSPLVSKYSYLIVEASRMGGANATTILKSSQDLEKTIQLEREKDSMLKEYLYIIFAAQFILIGILYLLNTTLLPSIISMLKSGVGSAFGISAAATNIDFKRGFFHVIMINALASGIIAGQLTEGKARHGLKHSVILMMTSYAASLIFLLR